MNSIVNLRLVCSEASSGSLANGFPNIYSSLKLVTAHISNNEVPTELTI